MSFYRIRIACTGILLIIDYWRIVVHFGMQHCKAEVESGTKIPISYTK